MIYISTGGFSRLSLLEATELLLKNGVYQIELSGCRWSANDLNKLISIKTKDIHFQPHNYFPTKEKPFVLNLASLDKSIIEESIVHCQKAIELSSKLGQKYFSVHAGFLMDPKVDELGKKLSNRILNNRQEAIESFLLNINKLISFADEHQIRILIENNVLNKDNAEEFQQNPLLMVDPKECRQIMGCFSNKVGMLLDVAHLKVSANTLNFSKEKSFKTCNEYIEAYHLSENNGLYDENKSFDDSSWFWEYLNPKIDYVSIEVYTHDFKNLTELVKLTQQRLK